MCTGRACADMGEAKEIFSESRNLLYKWNHMHYYGMLVQATLSLRHNMQMKSFLFCGTLQPHTTRG